MPITPVMDVVARLQAALPRGRTLPPEAWAVRHAWMLRVLWMHAIGLFGWGLLVGHPVWHAAVDAAPIALCGLVGTRTGAPQRIRASAVTFGLLTSSAIVVHLMNGAIEGHFHFFVMVTLLALYEEWFPYLLAIAFVLAHHGVMGKLEPAAVFDHPDAEAHPWRWASIHALFITALSVVNIVSWRLQELQRARTASSEERLRWAFEDAPTGMAFVDLGGTVQRVNAALCRATGLAADELVGRPLRTLLVGHDGAGAFPGRERREQELRYRRADRTVGWALWHHSLIADRAGAELGWVTHCVDISERKRAEELLAWRATHDPLTGLPNRELFRRRVSEELDRRRASADDGHVTVLFVDIDNFKEINDSLGHSAGDRLLTAIAERLAATLRPGDVIARFGGDEFTLLLPGTPHESAGRQVAGRLVDALRAPFALGDEQVRVSASIGMVVADGDDDAGADALLRDADTAMYRAKSLGKGRLELF